MNDTSAPAATATLGLDHYGRVLLRQWRLLAVAVVLGISGAGGFLLLTPSEVTATTQVNLSVITSEPFSPQRAASGLLDDATESAIAGSYVVAERAADLLGGGVTADDLRGTVEVTISEGGTVAHVSATAQSFADAVARADATAAAYLAYRSSQAQERLELMVSRLSTRIDDLDTELADVNALLAEGPSGAQQAQATGEREQIMVELAGLLSQRNALQSIDTTGGNVLTAAADSPVQTAPSRSLALATGLGAGVFLGVLLAFAREPFDRRLRNTAEVGRAFGRVLTRLTSPRLAVPLRAPDVDALRVARERLFAEVPDGAATVLVLDDSGADDALAATGLATVTAQAGVPVHLVLAETPSTRVAPLHPAEGQEDPAIAAAEEVPGLSVRVCRIEALADVRAAHRRAEDDDGVTILAVSTADGEAAMLAGIRRATTIVAVLREAASTRTTAAWIRGEAEDAGRPIAGAIVLPRLHRAALRSRLGLARLGRRARPALPGRGSATPAAAPASESLADAV